MSEKKGSEDVIPTLKLSDIVGKWRDALQASQPIREYCLTKYNKAPVICVGIDGKTAAADTDCPLIILYPGTKMEGLELQEYTYTLPVGWTVLQAEVDETGNVKEYLGVTECDGLGQLIYQELAQLPTDHPISEVQYRIEPVAYYPRFTGRMDITLKIMVANGYPITY